MDRNTVCGTREALPLAWRRASPGPHAAPTGARPWRTGAGSRTASESRRSLRTQVAPWDWRKRWREGSWPRVTWRSLPGGGHSAGVSCHRRSAASGRHLRVPARQTRGRSPVRSCRTLGSVRGVPGNRHPLPRPAQARQRKPRACLYRSSIVQENCLKVCIKPQ